jgi:hypothetical protein
MVFSLRIHNTESARGTWSATARDVGAKLRTIPLLFVLGVVPAGGKSSHVMFCMFMWRYTQFYIRPMKNTEAEAGKPFFILCFMWMKSNISASTSTDD